MCAAWRLRLVSLIWRYVYYSRSVLRCGSITVIREPIDNNTASLFICICTYNMGLASLAPYFFSIFFFFYFVGSSSLCNTSIDSDSLHWEPLIYNCRLLKLKYNLENLIKTRLLFMQDLMYVRVETASPRCRAAVILFCVLPCRAFVWRQLNSKISAIKYTLPSE